MKKAKLWAMSAFVSFFFSLVGIFSSAQPSGTLVEVGGKREKIESVFVEDKKVLISDGATELGEFENGLYASYLTTTLTDATRSGTTFSFAFAITLDNSVTNDLRNGQNFALGYYGEGDYYLPLTLKYDVTDEDGNRETRYHEVNTVSSSVLGLRYYSFGPRGNTNLSMDVDLFIDYHEELDIDSVEFYNIFPIDLRGNNLPEITTPLCITDVTVADSARNVIDVDNYLSITLNRISQCGSYTSFNTVFHNNMEELYHLEMSSSEYYEANMNLINNRGYYFYYHFNNLNTAYIELYYEDDTVAQYPLISTGVKITTFLINEGDTRINFMMKDVSVEGLVGASFCAANFVVRVRDSENGGFSRTGDYNIRFNGIYMEPPEGEFENVSWVNVILNLVIEFIVITVVYAGLAVAYYFYSKEKYKNDEFRRINNKEYVKTTLMGYATTAIFVLDILIIVYRAAYLDTILAMFNPLDNFIVVLSILSILLIGYFVKFFWNMFKDYKARREAIKLNLNDDTADDGTK